MNIGNEIYNMILAIICSVIASYLFWLYSFKKTRVKVIFSDQIEKSKSKHNINNYRYRLKIINIGKRDLHELSFVAKLSIRRKRSTNSSFLRLGHQEIIPILYGKKHQNKKENKHIGFSWTLQFHLTDDFFQEFSKNLYPAQIRSKARSRELTLDDIFYEFKEKARISVYAFGYDSATGARKMFVSKPYTIEDMKVGKFNHGAEKDKYCNYVKYIMTINEEKKAEKKQDSIDT